MSYNTLDDILGEISPDVLLQLVDDTNTGLTMDMIVLAFAAGNLSGLTVEQQTAAPAAVASITKILNRASAEVDGYCSNLYEVPFDTATPFLMSIDLDIAIYHLFSRRENVPENRKDRYRNAVKVLVGISTGTIQLGASKMAPTQKGQVIAVSAAPPQIFTRERLENY